jgi:hypothetical protein
MLCAIGLSAFGACLLYLIVSSVSESYLDNDVRDVLEYWASGRLLLQHQNPYDAASVFQLEQSAGAPSSHDEVMFNPPCALPFVLPLGLFSARSAIMVWLLAMIALLMISIRILWIVHGKRADRLHLLIYIFAPVTACISQGQIVPLMLFGLASFLWLYRDRPLLAGLCVPLLAIKPHLLFPFGLVVLLWALRGKRYSFLAGTLLGFTALFGIAIFFDHQVLTHYLPALHAASFVASHGMPNVSTLLHRPWPAANILQYVPELGATCWAIWWYIRRRHHWDWNDDGLLLIAVSVVVAPYSWFFDEIVVIPAMLNGIYRCSESVKSLSGFSVLNGAALALIVFNVDLLSGAYIWTSLAWLGWACYARMLPPPIAHHSDSYPVTLRPSKAGL